MKKMKFDDLNKLSEKLKIMPEVLLFFFFSFWTLSQGDFHRSFDRWYRGEAKGPCLRRKQGTVIILLSDWPLIIRLLYRWKLCLSNSKRCFLCANSNLNIFLLYYFILCCKTWAAHDRNIKNTESNLADCDAAYQVT